MTHLLTCHPIAAMTAQGWRPGAGDPDFLGWLTTLTYVAVAWLCAWAGRNELRLRRTEGTPERPVFWIVLAALLVLMGLNKQLDAQTWVVARGQEIVRDGGALAGQATLAKVVSVLTLALAGAGVLLALTRYLGQPWRRYLLALVGLLYLGCFVVVRAAEFLPVVRQINRQYKDGIHLVLELGAILMIGASAARAIGRERRRRKAREAAPATAEAAAPAGPESNGPTQPTTQPKHARRPRPPHKRRTGASEPAPAWDQSKLFAAMRSTAPKPMPHLERAFRSPPAPAASVSE